MRRTIALVASTAIAVLGAAGPAAAGGDGHRMGGNDGHMDDGHMDDGHMGGSGKRSHAKNARVVPGARQITVEAKSFEFDPDEITVQAGEDVTIVLRSRDILHDLVVKGEGHIVAAEKKKTARGGLMLDEPGTYKFWCSVPGHRGAGMKGTVIVQ